MVGVITRSPRRMTHLSPSMVVYAPSPCSMKRTAFGVWRCAGATSPGSRYWTATEIVCVLVRSGTPGLSRRRTRRSAPRPGFMNSGLRRTSGSMSAQRQSRASTAEALGWMSGPGRVHGASSPAARRLAQYSSRPVTGGVWIAITVLLGRSPWCFASGSGRAHERFVHPVGAAPAGGAGPTQGQEASRLLGVGDRHLLEDADGALAMVLLHFHVLVVEVEGLARDPVVLLHRRRHPGGRDVVDRLRGDVAPAQRLQRGGALELEQLVLLDDRRRQVRRAEDLVTAPAQPLAEPDEEIGVRGLLAADRVVTALLDHERDERALALEVLPRRGEAADGDDLPGRVAQGVEEEAPLLADDVPDLVAAQLAGADHPEEPVVEPGMGVPRLREQRRGELPWCERHDVSPPAPEGGDREASVYSPSP